MQIVFESENIVAIDKPAGKLVIPGRGDESDASLREDFERAGRKIFIVHRIDRETSGLVLFAKNAEAHKRICAQFEARKVRKAYLALVDGRLLLDGELNQPLKEFGSGRVAVDSGGKPSVTKYTVREAMEAASYLEAAPVTGRRHQIRAHLYAAGHPVMGDRLYGKQRPVGGVNRLMLHAWKLEIPLESIKLEVKPPADFEEILARFRG